MNSILGLISSGVSFLFGVVVDESVRKFVVEKLQPLLENGGDLESMREIKNQIQAFIRDYSEEKVEDKRLMQFLINSKDTVDQIEIALETYSKEQPQNPSLFQKLVTTKIPFRSNFLREKRKIQARIGEFEAYRRTMGDIGGGRQKKRRRVDREHRLRPMGIPDIVGFTEDTNKIVKYLQHRENTSLAVVVIAGMGGSGKSTITLKLCNSDVKDYFKNVIWVDVNQDYSMLSILRQMAQELKIPKTYKKGFYELQQLTRDTLENQTERFLFVLDNVWEEEVWKQISEFLPDKNDGSRVIITTRFEHIAKVSNKFNSFIHKLQPLNLEDSRELFLKCAVSQNDQRQDPDFINLANKFAAKCNGYLLH